jgi:RNase P subunit RPR2
MVLESATSLEKETKRIFFNKCKNEYAVYARGTFDRTSHTVLVLSKIKDIAQKYASDILNEHATSSCDGCDLPDIEQIEQEVPYNLNRKVMTAYVKCQKCIVNIRFPERTLSDEYTIYTTARYKDKLHFDSVVAIHNWRYADKSLIWRAVKNINWAIDSLLCGMERRDTYVVLSMPTSDYVGDGNKSED